MQNLSISDVTLKGATANINLEVFNPNASSLNIHSVSYAVQLNGRPVAEGVKEEPTKLIGKSTTSVVIPVKFEYSQIFSSLLDAIQLTKAEYKVSGAAKLGLFTLPFTQAGEISLKDKK